MHSVSYRSIMSLVLIAAATTFLGGRALAQDLTPEALVRKVTADVLEAIQNDEALKAGDRRKAIALAEEKVLPHIDFREMTRLAAGKAWPGAEPEQRDRLVAEFREMLVRTYASAIDAYKGQSMRVLPVRMPPDATEVTVRNLYMSPGKPAVPVEYYMLKTSAGWKIVDIVVEGVSLVLTYRTEFEEESRRTGIDGLIARLKEKNRVPKPAPGTAKSAGA